MKLDTIVCGNCFDVMAEMPDGSVHCSMTSPPYFGLRKYSGEQQTDWPQVDYSPMPGLPPITIKPMTCALGHEPTVEAYIGHLVAIYKEVRRVLRDDGVAWIVMGDSYVSNLRSGRKESPGVGAKQEISPVRTNLKWQAGGGSNFSWTLPNGTQQGDLMMVPHRLALALQADGWIVRNDLVWAKKAPMPESVAGWRRERHRIKVKKSDRATNPYQNGAGTKQGAGVASRAQREAYEQGIGASEWQDCPGCPKCEANGGYVLRKGSWRHTRAHEYVFMLTKQMQYWADQEAVREPHNPKWAQRRLTPTLKHQELSMHRQPDKGIQLEPTVFGNPSGRNPRSVLCPSPEPFPGQHFAVYPSGLIEPLIKATCPARCCLECGQGWAPIIEKRKGQTTPPGRPKGYSYGSPTSTLSASSGSKGWQKYGSTSNVLGYRPTCECGRDDWVSGLVFDPFVGSGTTAVAAIKLGRHFYGCDISQEYVDIANARIAKAQLAMPI